MSRGVAGVSSGSRNYQFARIRHPLAPKKSAEGKNIQLTGGMTQLFCCVVIPILIDVGGPWKVLPIGIHDASLEEVRIRYATNEYREELFGGFVRGIQNLRGAGTKAIFLNGGFVGENPKPSDFDCCWDPTGVDLKKLDPVFLDFANKRDAQKKKYRGEFFPSTFQAAPGEFFLDYFQRDKHTGQAKGILRVHS